MTTTKIETSPEMREFNRLIEAFDSATGFRFDEQTDISNICLVSDLWPTCEWTLSRDISEASESIQQ